MNRLKQIKLVNSLNNRCFLSQILLKETIEKSKNRKLIMVLHQIEPYWQKRFGTMMQNAFFSSGFVSGFIYDLFVLVYCCQNN